MRELSKDAVLPMFVHVHVKSILFCINVYILLFNYANKVWFI